MGGALLQVLGGRGGPLEQILIPLVELGPAMKSLTSGEKLESAEFAGQKRLPFIRQLLEESRGSVVAAEVVDGDGPG